MRIIMTMMFAMILMLSVSIDARAQDSKAGGSENMQVRKNLAGMMHEIKPARGQVEAAIESVARRLQPKQQQEFKDRMIQSFDFEKLENLSIGAMAEVFTEAELEKMVAYYGSREAQAIGEKMPVYQSVMQPEITKMLDEAILEARTGGGSDVMPTAPSGDDKQGSAATPQ